MENNFRKCLIFRENKLSSTKFRKKNYKLYHNYKIIIYYYTLRKFATSNTIIMTFFIVSHIFGQFSSLFPTIYLLK